MDFEYTERIEFAENKKSNHEQKWKNFMLKKYENKFLHDKFLFFLRE